MNRYAPHVYIIPEDDANRQFADGFVLHHQVKDTRIQVVAPAGGWSKVLKVFQEEYISKLHNYVNTHVIMVIDFDDQVETRKALFEGEIPDELKGRVFVIGSKRTPETLKNELNKSFEEIGRSLADDCDAGTAARWDHEQLKHNEGDRQRLIQTVKPFLF